MAGSRMFGNKKYIYANTRKTKKEAREYASWLRDRYFLARIIKTKKGYDIYRR